MTPVESGSPVPEVRTMAVGVPREGVTIVQEVVRQTLPEPLDDTMVSATKFEVFVQRRKPVAAAPGIVTRYEVTEVGAIN